MTLGEWLFLVGVFLVGALCGGGLVFWDGVRTFKRLRAENVRLRERVK